jgi:hypothetical protein
MVTIGGAVVLQEYVLANKSEVYDIVKEQSGSRLQWLS